MTEILTESFCERCGTRYTFESARPKTRLKGMKVLSRGLKNFVLSDDTSMDEAMAAARSETDRELTSHQLDAFHKTFNFCMSCRQYTCPNCWNEVEARCLSCAPHLGHEVMPASFPDLPSGPLVSDAAIYADPVVATNGTSGANGLNGAAHAAELVGMAEVKARHDGEIDAAARLATLTTAAATPPTIQPEPPAAPDIEIVAEKPAASAAPVAEPPAPAPAKPAPPVAPAVAAPSDASNPYEDVDPSTPTWLKALVVGSQAADAPAVDQPAAVVPAARAVPPAARPLPQPEPVVELEPVVEPEPVVEAPAAIEAEPEIAHEPATLAIDEKAAAQTGGLLQQFRPIDETEPQVAAAAINAAAIVDEPASPAEPSHGTPVDEPDPEPVASIEPDPIAAAAAALAAAAFGHEPEPTTPAAPHAPFVLEPAPAPAAPVQAPAPAAPVQAPPPAVPDLAAAATAAPAAPAEDVVRQPVWQMVAPDDQTRPIDGAAGTRAEPQWPTRPEWPDRASAAGLPFLNRPATPTGGLEALWAESSREVGADPSKKGRPANVVQPCVSCGLSLSATARFCRRCGTPQGS